MRNVRAAVRVICVRQTGLKRPEEETDGADGLLTAAEPRVQFPQPLLHTSTLAGKSECWDKTLSSKVRTCLIRRFS